MVIVGNIFCNILTKTSKEYLEDFLIPLIEGDSDIFFLGLFGIGKINSDVLCYIQYIFEKIKIRQCNIHLVLNNHDRNVLDLFKYIPNTCVYTIPCLLKINKLKVYIIPYNSSKTNIPDNDIIICNTDHNELSSYKVYSGLDTTPKKSKEFRYIGNSFDKDQDDIGIKGIYVINDGEVFIENKLSPKYVNIDILKEDDIELLNSINKNDHIQISVLNSLISDRKIRRKLENLDIKCNITYIDDLVDKSEPISSINIDYEDVIINYINNNIDNSIKDGVLDELNQVNTIYKEKCKI